VARGCQRIRRLLGKDVVLLFVVVVAIVPVHGLQEKVPIITENKNPSV